MSLGQFGGLQDGVDFMFWFSKRLPVPRDVSPSGTCPKLKKLSACRSGPDGASALLWAEAGAAAQIFCGFPIPVSTGAPSYFPFWWF